uniref:GNAT family N-acetyltransferase n=1 Tax=candidate division CPR3 bacterium TaxID=2268181 RepID=A0A7C4M2S0_UNCC3
MSEIKYVRFDFSEVTNHQKYQLIECYREIFSVGVKKEWLKCRVCGQHWGLEDHELLLENRYYHCGEPLTDFWSRHELLDYLENNLTSPGTSCCLVFDGSKMVALGWGYPATIMELEEKLEIEIDLGFPPSYIVAYQEKSGVLPEYRDSKIGKVSFTKRVDDYLAAGLEYGIVRTIRDPQPNLIYLWLTKKLGYKVIATYPGNDGRVVIGGSLKKLRNLLG